MKRYEPRLNVLFLEAYPGASHERVIELLRRYSRHSIEVIQTRRDHWKHLALVGHFELAESIAELPGRFEPDLLIFSGAVNIPAFLQLVPEALRGVPRIAYFHESQWTYPTGDTDVRPFLVQHIDAVACCTECWFNSAFHMREFWSHATSPDMDARIRRVARGMYKVAISRSRVVYPPVQMDTGMCPPNSERLNRTVLWNARWEADKRPDRFVEAVTTLCRSQDDIRVKILGTAGKAPDEIAALFEGLPVDVIIPGHLENRAEYEHALRGAGTVVSTADHEFFGVGVLEAVLAGNVPVLPRALAYPETMPSAWFYTSGDIDDLVSTIGSALDCRRPLRDMHSSDARRYLAESAVARWDAGVELVWSSARLDR